MTNYASISPREVWRRKVGGIQSRNSMLHADSRIFVGTCGAGWNIRDRDDGVFCLNRNDGKVIWFTPTTADVNEIALAGQNILAPTDAGDVFVLDADTGEIVQVYRADSAVLGRPLITEGVGGWTAVFASLSGTVYLIDEHSQELVKLGEIGGRIRASLVQLSPSMFLAATERGYLVEGKITGRELHARELASAPPDEDWGGGAAFTATPLLVGKKLYAGYARETYGQNPAVFCVNLDDGQIEWVSRADDIAEINFGNVRTTPALVGDKLVIASAYTDGLDILDASTGKFLQRVVLGQNTFQQWSSPIRIGEGHVAVGRVNGVCSIIDIETTSLVASISLATAQTEHLAKINADGPYDSRNFALYPGEPAPEGGICGTPMTDGEMLFVGTTDGILVGIRMFDKSTIS